TVRTLDHGVHSGMFGGACPDAITTLCRLMATLHDDQGDVAIEGLVHTDAPDVDYDEARLREESGLLEGTELIGTGSIPSRLWTKPAAVVIGIDAPAVDEAGNVLAASARAKINLRLNPTQDPEEAWQALQRHLPSYAPGGAPCDQARAACADGWGTQPVDAGIGGSFPFVQAFAENFPDAASLVTGVEDPDTRAHGANESLHLGEFEKVCTAEALLLARLGAM